MQKRGRTAGLNLCRLCFALGVMTQASSGQEITISAWNIAANAHTITTQIENNIADGIAQLNSDLIGLSEEQDEESLNRIADRLRAAHNLDYETRFCERTDKLHLAVLVRSGLNVSSAIDVVGTDLNDTRHRRVCAVSASIGAFDFVLGTVHFKSGGGGSRNVRIQQANATAAFFRGATLFDERDTILIGDYNMFPQRDRRAFAALSPTGFLRFLSTEELCNTQGLNCDGTHISGNSLRNMLDGFGISQPVNNEYIDGSFRRVDLHTQMGLSLGQFRNQVSHHLPLLAKFSTSGPDDD